MRILVHSGKGGVGKTSVSAATALRCADEGKRTLVLSTDGAHSLADSLAVALGPEPRLLLPNLWAQEVDARHSVATHWGELQRQFSAYFRRQGMHELHSEEINILPGLEEIAHLLWLEQHAASGEYDVVIVDAAPTAETLRLLSLPDVTRWWFERMLEFANGARSWLRPIGRFLAGKDFPEIQENAIQQARVFFQKLDRVRELLSDPATTSLRLVVNPESMVIRETQRMYTFLCLYGYATDAIICNRIIPASVRDPYFAHWRATQQANIDRIGNLFGEIPLLRAPLFGREVSGLDGLCALADELYGEESPTRVFLQRPSQVLEAMADGGTLLKVALPFARHEELDLYHAQEELALRVGNYRRNILLPFALWEQEITRASFEDSTLLIRFERRQPVEAQDDN